MFNTLHFDLFNQLPGYIGWKNTNFEHEGCNRNLANILGLKDICEIKGLRDEYFNPDDEDLIQFHRQNDVSALCGETIKALHKSTFPYDGSYYYFIKKPILNRENHIIGILYHCQEFANSKFLIALNHFDRRKMPSAMTPNYYYVHDHLNPFKLSERELESLFFMLRGKSAKQIAQILKLSQRTIESYAEQIKNKLGCRNKTEVLCLAIANGYMNIIPPRLLGFNFL
ncbi:MAG: response regulator transcription factor [Gammaproteobacteria bacterium]